MSCWRPPFESRSIVRLDFNCICVTLWLSTVVWYAHWGGQGSRDAVFIVALFFFSVKGCMCVPCFVYVHLFFQRVMWFVRTHADLFCWVVLVFLRVVGVQIAMPNNIQRCVGFLGRRVRSYRVISSTFWIAMSALYLESSMHAWQFFFPFAIGWRVVCSRGVVLVSYAFRFSLPIVFASRFW